MTSRSPREPALASVGAGTAPAPERARRISPSWVTRLIAWVERLPGPSWPVYLIAAVVEGLITSAFAWATGTAPVGEFSGPLVYYGALPVAILWTMHNLDGTARRALIAFRPALTLDEGGYARLLDELTVVPARGVWITTVAVFPLNLLWYASDPVGTATANLSIPALAIRALNEGLVTILFIVLIYHTIRQLRAVSRIHEQATLVELFRPAPLYAFSRLTSRTAILLLVLTFSSLVVDPASWTSISPIWMIGWAGGALAVALTAFVLPLAGIHGRIVAEKLHLEAEVGSRLTGVMASVHAIADADDLARADGLNKLLASLIAERELVGRLPTWPWQPGTMGAVLSAIVLPIGLFLATRMLERVV